MSEQDELQELEEMAAAMLIAGSQAPIVAESSRTTPDHTEAAIVDSGPVEPGATAVMPAAEAERENEPTITNQPLSPLASLDLDTAIRLRWALRDIKGKRTKLTPVNRDDLRTLLEMALVEMRDDVPVLTNEGHQELD
jgi:hypothetical protein